MDQRRRLGWLLGFGRQLAIAATIGGTAAMSWAARRYLTAALDIMEGHAVMRREINWEPLRRQAYERTKTALRPFQTLRAPFALSCPRLAIITAGSSSQHWPPCWLIYTAADSPSPQGKILSGRIGYVLVPPIVAASQETIDGSATRLGSDRAGHRCPASLRLDR